jgi:hypothetical protein
MLQYCTQGTAANCHVLRRTRTSHSWHASCCPCPCLSRSETDHKPARALPGQRPAKSVVPRAPLTPCCNDVHMRLLVQRLRGGGCRQVRAAAQRRKTAWLALQVQTRTTQRGTGADMSPLAPLLLSHTPASPRTSTPHPTSPRAFCSCCKEGLHAACCC